MAAQPISILLDLDGTVVDSKPGILASCSAALRSLGHRPDSLDIDNLIGPPLEEVMAEILGRFADDRVAEAVLAYRDHYGTAGFLETTLYPGLAAALDQLLALQAKLYIATSKRTVFAKQILEHLGLIDLFAGVHGSEPGGAVDRKADVIAGVLRRHELSADRCLMIGDRRQDVEGAQTNRVSTVGVLWGYGDREELLSAGVMHVVARPTELIPIAEAYARRLGLLAPLET
jgi:phosphoglycolate phosphatase